MGCCRGKSSYERDREEATPTFGLYSYSSVDTVVQFWPQFQHQSKGLLAGGKDHSMLNMPHPPSVMAEGV